MSRYCPKGESVRKQNRKNKPASLKLSGASGDLNKTTWENVACTEMAKRRDWAGENQKQEPMTNNLDVLIGKIL